MKMEIEIISKDCIKPSSPTPHHLKTHKLSFLDQFVPPCYFPLAFYYPFNLATNHSSSNIDSIVSTRLQLLKQSLSETLSDFYPFAGKIKDLHSIDCNDEGVYFAEARVKSPLHKFLNNTDSSVIKNFLPDGAKWITEPVVGNYVAGVQLTTFACGGIVVGIIVSHMIVDATALRSFIKSWAASAMACKNNTEPAITCPKFDAASFFPPNDTYQSELNWSPTISSYVTHRKCVTRRFVFDASAIASLKAKTVSSRVQNPTRVEAVTSLLFKCIMYVSKARSDNDSDKPLVLNHAVNLRRKATPPFSEYQMGNWVRLASVVCKNDQELELNDIVCQLREAKTKTNGDFVNGLLGDKGLHNFMEAVKHERETSAGAADGIIFSSWCNMGFYDIDFGWGKPAWMSILDYFSWFFDFDSIILMDTRMGNGIEAWMFLPEEDLAKLVVDKELLSFATLDSI